jgi:hypothetical protein
MALRLLLLVSSKTHLITLLRTKGDEEEDEDEEDDAEDDDNEEGGGGGEGDEDDEEEEEEDEGAGDEVNPKDDCLSDFGKIFADCAATRSVPERAVVSSNVATTNFNTGCKISSSILWRFSL